jgi:hypothetical protein
MTSLNTPSNDLPQPAAAGAGGDRPVIVHEPNHETRSGSSDPGPGTGVVPVFIPTALQERILAALEGKALTLDALAEKLDADRSNLHRRALKELMRCGLVGNHLRVGYYRPDAPPAKYADQLGPKPV